MTVSAPVESILPLISDLHRWVDWSPWEGLDPDLQRTYSGAESGEGAAYAWSGNKKAGSGHMLVTGVDHAGSTGDGSGAVRLNVDFVKPFKSSSKVEFLLTPVEGGTNVRWLMHSPQTAMTRVFGLVMNMEKMIGGDLEKGLAQLAKAVG